MVVQEEEKSNHQEKMNEESFMKNQKYSKLKIEISDEGAS